MDTKQTNKMKILRGASISRASSVQRGSRSRSCSVEPGMDKTKNVFKKAVVKLEEDTRVFGFPYIIQNNFVSFNLIIGRWVNV